MSLLVNEQLLKMCIYIYILAIRVQKYRTKFLSLSLSLLQGMWPRSGQRGLLSSGLFDAKLFFEYIHTRKEEVIGAHSLYSNSQIFSNFVTQLCFRCSSLSRVCMFKITRQLNTDMYHTIPSRYFIRKTREVVAIKLNWKLKVGRRGRANEL